MSDHGQQLLVVYDGPWDDHLDEVLRTNLSRLGFGFCGAGNDPELNERHLVFDRSVSEGPSLGEAEE